MRINVLLILFMLLLAPAALILLTSCEITGEGMDGKEVVLEEIFPPSKTVSSYRQTAPPKQVKGDELAVQLGGKEREAILKKWSSFASRICEYGLPDKPPLVRVTVSEMATRLDAFGAFSNLRPAMLPENQYVKVGVQGVLDGERLIFVHDRYLIVVRHLQAGAEEQRRALLLNFGRGISRRIPRPMVEPSPIIYLPGQNRVPGTERLDKEDPVGLGVVDNGVSAVYRINNREGRMFMTQVSEAFRKLTFLQKYKKSMEAEGPVKELQIGDGSYLGKLNKMNAVIAQREDVVYGILGTLEEEEMLDIMAAADRLIKPYTPVKYKDVQEKKEEEEKKGGIGFGG